MESRYIPDEWTVVKEPTLGIYGVKKPNNTNFGFVSITQNPSHTVIIMLIGDTLVAAKGIKYEINNGKHYLDGRWIGEMKLDDSRIVERKAYQPGNDVNLPAGYYRFLTPGAHNQLKAVLNSDNNANISSNQLHK